MRRGRIALGAALLTALLGMIALRRARSDLVLRTVTLQDNPTAVGVDMRTGRAFVAASGAAAGSDGRVYVFDSTTGALLRTITVGYNPNSIAVDERMGRVFVANTATLDSAGSPTGAGSVTVLDARDGHIVRTISIGASADAVAVGGQVGHLFIVSRGTLHGGGYTPGTLLTLDVASGRLLHTATIGLYPTAIAVDDRIGHVIVTNLLSNSVSVLDARSGRLLRTVVLGPAPGTLAATTVDARTGRVFTLSFPPHIAGGGGPSTGEIDVLLSSTGRLLHRVTLNAPYGLCVDGRSGRVLVGGTSGARVLDGTNGRLLGTIPMGPFQALALDDRRDRAFAITGSGVARDPDPWAWVPAWLRRRVPFFPAPGAGFHPVPGNVRMLALPR